MSPDYYAKDGYYTRTNTEYDRWEGTLAKAMGLEGQVTKEQFEENNPSRSLNTTIPQTIFLKYVNLSRQI